MPEINLIDILSNTLNKRHIVILLTLFFSMATYYYLVDFYANDFSIFSYLPFRQLPSQNFYSGAKGLNYHLVGSYLQEAFPDDKVRNKPTKGGIENAEKVLTSKSPSFGLVQEDAFKPDDFMKGQLNFAAPIYLERMHVIYDRKVFERYRKGSQDGNMPQISSHTRPELLDFFANAKISIGPVGSGTRKIASYIMESINEQIRARQDERINTNQSGKKKPPHSGANSMMEHKPGQDDIHESVPQILATDTRCALGCLNAKYPPGNQPPDCNNCEDGTPDIVFVITGSPCKSIADLIMDRSDKFGLISIDSTFINNLNLKHGTNFRATDFNCKYDPTRCGKENPGTSAGVGGTTYNGVATLGTYAYLVTDQRTLTTDILEILERLNDLKVWSEGTEKSRDEKIKEGEDKFRLAEVLRDDFDFLYYYKKQSHSRFMLSLRNLLVFLMTLGTTFTPSFVFLSWFVSGIQQMNYLSRLRKIIEESIPINEEPEQTGHNEESIPINEEPEQTGHNEADDADGVVKSGVGDRKNLHPNLNVKQKSTASAMISLRGERWTNFTRWIDSSNRLVREFIGSGKVTGEGAKLNDGVEEDRGVGNKENGGSAGRGNANDRKYPLPTIKADQTHVIKKIIKGLKDLNKLRKDISKDTGVNDTHTTFLIGRIDQIVDKLRKSLGIRLNGVIENHDQEVDKILLVKYLTADWITKDDYEWLITKIPNVNSRSHNVI